MSRSAAVDSHGLRLRGLAAVEKGPSDRYLERVSSDPLELTGADPDKRGPVPRVRERRPAVHLVVPKPPLRAAEGVGSRLSSRHPSLVELFHEETGRLVVHVPESREDVARSGEEERLREADEPLPTNAPTECGLAGTEYDEVRVELPLLDHFPRGEESVGCGQTR